MTHEYAHRLSVDLVSARLEVIRSIDRALDLDYVSRDALAVALRRISVLEGAIVAALATMPYGATRTKLEMLVPGIDLPSWRDLQRQESMDRHRARGGKKMTRVYLAASYPRHAEMKQLRDRLREAGVEVTSRWIDMHSGQAPDAANRWWSRAISPGAFARADVEDVLFADVFVIISGGPSTSGGRHFKTGLAYAHGKRIVLIGPRENVFHCLPTVFQLDTVDDLVTLLSRSGWREAMAEHAGSGVDTERVFRGGAGDKT